MNPLLARLYPHLALGVKQAQSKPNQGIRPIQETKPEPIKETIKKDPIPEPKTINNSKSDKADEIDKYIEELEEKYSKQQSPPKERKYTKPPIPKKQTDDEKKERILKALSKKKITQANKEIEQMKKLHEETGGDEKELKKKEAELRRGIKLIRNCRILTKTGDLNNEEPEPEPEPEPEAPE